MTVEEGEIPAEVYVVMRVFKIDDKNPGLRIYFDPWALHLEDKLNFVPESYTVTAC